MIEALPNITQNPLSYATCSRRRPRAPGRDTTSINSFGIGVDGRRQWSAVGINGGRAFTNDIQLDGLPVMGGGYNEASVVPNTEGLQEVRVIQNNFSAEYGRGQAIISMSTKSGTNAFHGNGVYMLRHESLDANTFANNAQNIAKRPFRVNDAGGSIGGPILRNKLFFFSSYHGLRNNQTTTGADDGPDRARAGRQLQPDAHPDENGNPCRRGSSIRSTSSQKRPTSTAAPRSRTRSSRTRIRTRCGCSATTRCRTGRRTTSTTRTTSSRRRRPRCGGTATTTASTSSSAATRSTAAAASRYAEIITPRPFGTAPFNDAPGIRSDKNPYIQLGDAIVLTPSLVADVRYGLSRINTKNLSGNKTGFDDYAAFGVPSNLLPLILFPGTAPNVNPNGYGGGSGGGSNWTALTTGNFNTKREYQTSHSITGSITKIRGKWTHKGGMEFRNLMSNYADPEQGSVAMPSPFAHQGGNFNFEYVTASGSVAKQTSTNAQRGVNAAGMLLGTGVWWIRPGANVTRRSRRSTSRSTRRTTGGRRRS